MPSSAFQAPMLATAGPPPRGDDWVHEVKWDGIRAIVDVSPDGVVVHSRNGRDISVAFPELQRLAETVPDALLDGEIITLDRGIPSFARLAERIHVSDRARAAALAKGVPATYMVFDVLRLYGVDLTPRDLKERRRSLDQLDLPAGAASLSPLYDDGAALFDATREQGLEGVVAKRLGSTYHPGRRSRDWIKTPHRTDTSVVVGGWRVDTGSRSRIGAVLVGQPLPGGPLVYAGRVGSGIGEKQATQLAADLAPLVRDESPFDDVPRIDATGTTWVEPRLVVDVTHLGRTDGERLRQPVFRRIRTDLEPTDLYEGST